MQLIYVDLNAKDPHYVTILTCYKLGQYSRGKMVTDFFLEQKMSQFIIVFFEDRSCRTSSFLFHAKAVSRLKSKPGPIDWQVDGRGAEEASVIAAKVVNY